MNMRFERKMHMIDLGIALIPHDSTFFHLKNLMLHDQASLLSIFPWECIPYHLFLEIPESSARPSRCYSVVLVLRQVLVNDTEILKL
jgi:hypothetical protein